MGVKTKTSPNSSLPLAPGWRQQRHGREIKKDQPRGDF